MAMSFAVVAAAGPQTAAAPAAGADGLPFAPGERLVFRVEWNPPWYLFFLPSMEAGEAILSIAGEQENGDLKLFKIVFQARSSGTLARLAGVEINDHFEFYTSPGSFCTTSVSKRIREGKRKRDIDVTYFPDARRLYIREVNVAADPPRVDIDKYVEAVPPCVQDLFSALYSMRQRELRLGAAHRTLVGDNDRVKEIEARVEKKEFVNTPSGRYETWKVNTVALLGGLFKDGGQFRIWMTADGRKVPVKFEARVGLGKVSGELKQMTQ